MELKIPEAQMQELVAAAIFKTIDENSRRVLIEEAIKHLITPPPKRNSWDPDNLSPLQQAFRNALYAQASKIIQEELSTDEAIRDQVKGMLSDAVKHAFEETRDETVRRVSAALVSALIKD